MRPDRAVHTFAIYHADRKISALKIFAFIPAGNPVACPWFCGVRRQDGGL